MVKHISGAARRVFITLLILLALVISAGYLLAPMANGFRTDLESRISAMLDMPVSLGELTGEFSRFNPALGIESLVIFQPLHPEQPSLEFYDLTLELDTLKSLINMTPVFRHATVGRGDIHVTASDSQISLTGHQLPKPPNSPQGPNLRPAKPNYRGFYDFLAQHQVDFRNISFFIHQQGGDTHVIEAERINLSGPPLMRKMSAVVNVDGGQPVVFSVTSAGRGQNWPNVYFDGYLSFPEFNYQHWQELLQPFLKDSFFKKKIEAQINQLRSGAQLWFAYTPEGWTVRGDVEVEIMDIDLPDRILPPISHLKTGFAFTFGRERPTQLWLNDLSFQFSGLTYPASDLYLSYERKPESALLVAADKVHLQPLNNIVDAVDLLPEKLESVVRELAPKGMLEKMVVRLKPGSDLLDLEWSADLKGVSVERWRGAPSGANINARVWGTASEGVIAVDSPGFELGLDNIFEDVWVFDRANALLTWRVENNAFQLRTDNIALQGGEGELKVRFRLDIPFAKEIDNWLALEAGMTNGDLAYVGKYLPVHVLTKDVNNWLHSAIKGGSIDELGFILNGSLVPKSGPGTMAWGLFANVKDTDFFYSPEWPELKAATAKVLLNQNGGHVDVAGATLYDSATVSDLAVELTNFQGNKPLEVAFTGSVDATGVDVERILQESALANALNRTADNWQVDGQLRADLNVRLPFVKSTASAKKTTVPPKKIDVTIKLNRNDLTIPDARLQLSDLTGQLLFSNQKGLTSQQLKGLVQGEPATASISSDVKGTVTNGSMSTRIAVNGSMSSKKLSKWLTFDLSPIIRGQSEYQADVVVGKGVGVYVTSSLKGMKSLLPKPLAKPLDQTRKLQLRIEADKGKPMVVDMNLAPGHGSKTIIRSLMQIDTGSGADTNSIRLERMGVQFGGSAVALPTHGVFVSGVLDELTISPWVDWWQQNQQHFLKTESASTATTSPLPRFWNTGSGGKTTIADRLRIRDLRIGHLAIDDQDTSCIYERCEPLSNVHLNLENKAEHWSLLVNSSTLKGQATAPHKQDEPLEILIDKVVLPKLSASAEVNKGTSSQVAASTKKESQSASSVSPKAVPAMNVQVKSIFQENQSIGSLSFSAEPIADGVRINDVRGSVVGMGLDASLVWSENEGGQMTELTNFMKTGHINQLLQVLHQPQLVNAKRFESYMKLYWPGSPFNLSADNLVGNIGLKMRDGSFDTSGATEALRIFGALNLDAITRRLRLDFSDIYQEGMSFDRLDGKASINKGKITLTDPIIIQGPSSDFKISGQLDLIHQTLDLGLIVTLPVTQNIAVVSLLLGQPYVAGAAYLFDKLLGNQVAQFASLRYEIGGSFEKPDITLDKLFSNSEKVSNKGDKAADKTTP